MKKDLKSLYDGIPDEDGTILGEVNTTISDNSEAIDPLEEIEKKKESEEK